MSRLEYENGFCHSAVLEYPAAVYDGAVYVDSRVEHGKSFDFCRRFSTVTA